MGNLEYPKSIYRQVDSREGVQDGDLMCRIRVESWLVMSGGQRGHAAAEEKRNSHTLVEREGDVT